MTEMTHCPGDPVTQFHVWFRATEWNPRPTCFGPSLRVEESSLKNTGVRLWDTQKQYATKRERGGEKRSEGGRCLEVWLGRANTICRRRAGADSPQRPCNRQTDRQRPIQEHAALARQAGGDRTWSILAAAWVRVGQERCARIIGEIGRGKPAL